MVLNFFGNTNDMKVDLDQVNEYVQSTGLPKAVYDNMQLKRNTVADALYYSSLKQECDDLMLDIMMKRTKNLEKTYMDFWNAAGKIKDMDIFQDDELFQSRLQKQIAEIYEFYNKK